MTNGGRLFNILHAGLMTRVLEGVLAAMQVLDDTPDTLMFATRGMFWFSRADGSSAQVRTNADSEPRAPDR